jgi:hypothetical protein
VQSSCISRGKMSRKLVLHIAKDFAVPEIYTSESVDDIQEALWIGATIQQSVRAFRSDSAVLKIKEDARQEVTLLKHALAEREKELSKEIKSIEEEMRNLQEKHISALKLARAEASDSTRRELSESMRAMETRLIVMEERKKSLEETRQEDISKARDTERKMMERVVTEKEKEISRLDACVKALQEAISRQTEEIGKLGGALTKRVSANVKTKGSAFENEFKENLVRAYGTIRDFDLKNTAHGAGHEGDFVMTIEGEQIMWELKDYTGDVPKKEVDKFFRDMKDYKGAKIGVMVSKVSDISGRHGAVVFEIVDNRLFVFVNKFDEWDDSGIGGTGLFQVLLQLFRTWWKVGIGKVDDNKGMMGGSEDIDMYTLEEMINMKQKIEETFATVQRIIEDHKRRRTEWRTHKGRLEETTRWVSHLLEESHTNLKRILDSLNGSADIENRVEEGDELEKTIFKSDLDDKGKEWISTILTYCMCTDNKDGCIELQDLETMISEKKRMSKDTIRGHILRVVNEDVIKKKGLKKAIYGLIKRG